MSEEEVDELFKSTIDTGSNEIDYRGTYSSSWGFVAWANAAAEFVKTIAEN